MVHGSATFEWLEGERFLIQRARTDQPEFPDSLAILGFAERDRVESAQGAAPPVSNEPPAIGTTTCAGRRQPSCSAIS